MGSLILNLKISLNIPISELLTGVGTATGLHQLTLIHLMIL